MLNDNWLKLVTDKYSEGYSDVEICRELKITTKQFNKTYSDNSKFAELIDFGRMLSHAWWMEKARTNLTERSFNSALYVMVMKNRYGWAEKLEAAQVESTDAQTLKNIKEALQKELPKLLKTLNPDLQDSRLLLEASKVLDETS